MMRSSTLPIRHDLGFCYYSSLAISLLVLLASVLGLLYPSTYYPTQPLRLAFVPNDVVNIVIGLPALVSCCVASHSILGLLLWPGALSYMMYVSLTYVLAIPSNTIVFYLQVMVFLLSSGAFTNLLLAMDGTKVKELLGEVSTCNNASGLVLVVWGLLFGIRAMTVLLLDSSSNNSSPVDSAVGMADLVIAPLWTVVGMGLYRSTPIGRAMGLGILFQGSLLFAGLIVVLLIQPVLFEETRLSWTDVVVVAGMASTVFWSFGRMFRAALVACANNSKEE